MPRKRETPQTEALFDPPETAPLPWKRPVKPQPDGVPKWSRYAAVNRLPCDECKQAQVRGELHDPARQARWKRVLGKADLLLCHEHARHWRELDGLDLPESMRPVK